MPAPRLSYVLVTDRAAAIEPVLRRLEAQTVRDVLEVVAVTAPGGAAELGRRLEAFACSQVHELGSILPLGRARARGVHAARAPVVFLGETHTYPGPGFVEALVAAHEEPWSAVAPALGNANPGSVLSWAAFLHAYARWLLPPGRSETDVVAVYNCSFKRDVLLSLEPDLAGLLEPSEGLVRRLRSGGHRFLVEPEAQLDHLNVDRLWPWLCECWLQGRLIGARGAKWSPARRLAYALAMPLVPGLILGRSRPHLSRARGILPRGTVPALALGATVSAAGELVSYLVGPKDAARRMLRYEIDKERFASSTYGS